MSTSLGITMFAQFQLYQRQQKELEKARADAEAANLTKTTFLANISHEIRTPIHVINSINELMRGLELTGQTRCQAKNLGLLSLAEEAERLERLFQNGSQGEAKSLLPHLRWLYEQAVESLEQLRPQMEDTVPLPAEAFEKLSKYLDKHQRSPALQCIDGLLADHPTPTQRALLEAMRSAVAAIDFETAATLCFLYQKRRRGGKECFQ